MTRADKEEWIEQVLQVPRSRFSEAAAHPVVVTPPSETERVKGVIAHASELIALADDRYREVKAGASQSSFASGLQDPGEKLRGSEKQVQAGVAAATAALKAGGLAKAAKLAAEAEKAGHDAYDEVTKFAVDLDHAAATVNSQTTSTPWGPVSLPYENATKMQVYIVPLSEGKEQGKTADAHYEAALDAQHKLMTPLMAYLGAPDKATQEVSALATEKSEVWAEQGQTAKLVDKFIKNYQSMLATLLGNARAQWLIASKEMEEQALRDKAAALRKKAEEMAKLMETLKDLVVGAAKTIASGGEAGPEAAKDLIGGLIGRYRTNKTLEEAEALEKQAGEMQSERLNIALHAATTFVAEIDGILSELAPLAGEAGDSAERKTVRAARQFDADADKDTRHKAMKFRFRDVATAQQGMRALLAAAVTRLAVWEGMEVNRTELIKALEPFGYSKNGYALFSGDTLVKAEADIAANRAVAAGGLVRVKEMKARLDLLFGTAMAALTKAGS